jgi:hypothetical protein
VSSAGAARIKLLVILPIPREDIIGTILWRWALNHEDMYYAGAFASPGGEHLLKGAAECVVDSGRRLVTVKFGKKLTFGDIERYAKRLLSNPSFQPDYSEIIDLTEVEELDLQADEFLKLSDKTDPFSPSAKRAFVVRTSTQNHAARMHKVLRTQRNIEIFRSIEEAERWVAS